MKVKLLRKLRKRFHWYMDGTSCWCYYDRKEKREFYAYKDGYYYINDMLQAELLGKLGLSRLFVDLKQRIEPRKKARREKALEQKYSKFFK